MDNFGNVHWTCVCQRPAAGMPKEVVEHLVIGVDPVDGKGKTADYFLVPNPNLEEFLNQPEVRATIEEVETTRESNIYGINNWPPPVSFDLDIKTLEICRKDMEEYLNSLQRHLMLYCGAGFKPIQCETVGSLCELVAVAKGIAEQKDDADEHLRNFLRLYISKSTEPISTPERFDLWAPRFKCSRVQFHNFLYSRPPTPFTDWFYDAVRDYFEVLLKEKPDECGVRK